MKRKPYRKDRKFKNDRACSLEEVAQEMGISIERARKIEATALAKCRDWCEENGYDLEMMLHFLAQKDVAPAHHLALDNKEIALD